MSVYIKGMEMPVTCCHCAFMYFDPDATNSNNGNPGSYLCPFTKAEIWNTQRDPDCPLVPVPDHGRLIDAGKAYEDAITQVSLAFVSSNKEQAAMAVANIIWNAPTIIPADKEAGE